MALLTRIMQIAQRMTGYDAGVIEGELVYDSIADAIAAHTSESGRGS